MFGAAVPQFTIDGKTHQGSSIGFLWTLVFYSVVLTFSTLKFLEMVTKDSPSVLQIYTPDNSTVNMSEASMMFAFGVRRAYGLEPLNDTSLVRWLPELIEGDGDLLEIKTELEFRNCTDDDLARFYPEKHDHRNFHDSYPLYCITGNDVTGKKIDLNLHGDSYRV